MSQVEPQLQLVQNEFSEEFLTEMVDVSQVSVWLFTRAYIFLVVMGALFVLGLWNAPLLWCSLGGLAVAAVQYMRMKTLGPLLSIERKVLNSACQTGDKIHFIYKVWNRSPYFHPPFLISDKSLYFRSATPIVALPRALAPNESLELRCDRICEAPAGSLSLGAFQVVVQDELGLFQISVFHTDDKLLKVRAVQSEAPVLQNAERSFFAGDLETAEPGEGLSLYGVREYRDGDPLNSICWKKWREDDGFFVKQFEANICQRVAICLAVSPSLHLGYGASSTWEVAKAHALTLIRAYLLANSSVSLITRSAQLKEISGAQNQALFENLLGHTTMDEGFADTQKEIEFYSLLLTPPCLVFFVTPYTPRDEAALIHRMQVLKKDGFQPVVILVNVADSASQVARRFGSFPEIVFAQSHGLKEASSRFHAGGIDAYVIGPLDLNGKIRVTRHA